MLKKVITYTDFDGNKKSGTYYFNMTRTDGIELYSNEDFRRGIDYLNDLRNKNAAVTASDSDVIILLKMFKLLILKTYGARTPDGESFIKTAADGHSLALDFEQTAAYDELFMSFVNNPKEFNDFIIAVVPQSVREQAEQAAQQANDADQPALNPAVAQIKPAGGVAGAGLSLV